MIVLIDADPIVYRCGFAAEKTNWHIIYSTAESDADEIEFESDDNGTAGDYMKEWMKFNDGKVTILDKSRVVEPDPVSYALRAVKVQIESIIESCEEHYGEPAKMLISVAPAGLEQMFFEFGVLLAEGATSALPPTKEEIEKLLAIAPRYGIEIKLPAH